MSEYVVSKYLRLSLEDADLDPAEKHESNSIGNQRKLLDEYISKHEDLRNATILEFCDDGKSGTSFERRGVKEMLDKAKRGRIHCIIVKDFSRFGRDYITVCDYLEQIFPFLGIRFISVNDDYDSKNQPYGSAGQLDIGFKAILHDLYSKELSQKLLYAKKKLFESGKYHSSFGFYGYIKSPTEKYKLLVEPKAAQTIRQIYEWIAQGETTVTVAKKLNDANVPTPLEWLRVHSKIKSWGSSVKDDNIWTSGTVLRIITDERYTGKSIYGKSKVKSIGSSHCVKQPKESWVVVPDRHEAIIPQELYDAVQEIRKKKAPRKNKTTVNRLFVRKIRCGYCGYTMNFHPGNNPFEKCEKYRVNDNPDCRSNRIYDRDLSKIVLDGINAQIQLASEMKKKSAVKQTSDERARVGILKELKNLQIKVKKQMQRKSEIFEQLLDEKITRQDYDSLCSRHTEQIAEYQTQIDALEKDLADSKSTAISEDDSEIVEHVSAMKPVTELNRSLVDEFLKSVIVYNDNRIELEWNYKNIFERTE